jgi:glycosyltransferase involved in cell wall biosynthesis
MEIAVPKVALPLYAIYHKLVGGTESAIYNLIKGLSQVAGTDIDLYYSSTERLAPEFLRWAGTARNIRQIMTRPLSTRKNIRFFEEVKFGLIHGDAELFLYPNYFCPPTRRKAGAKLTAVLHDIQYKALPQYHSRKRRIWLDFYLDKLFNIADHVYILSEFERGNILKYFGDRAAAKCIVTYDAIDWSRFERSADGQAEGDQLENPYILAVCHQFPHKNISTLVRAFDRLSHTNKDLRLVLVGKASEENIRFAQANLSASAAERVYFTGFVSDAELGRWYRNALLFVSPSLYEGFGMPAVEAMGLGVRTIVSYAGSMPEITLHKAEYVMNPLDVGEWVEALKRNIPRPQLAPAIVAEIRARYDAVSVARRYLAALEG